MIFREIPRNSSVFSWFSEKFREIPRNSSVFHDFSCFRCYTVSASSVPGVTRCRPVVYPVVPSGAQWWLLWYPVVSSGGCCGTQWCHGVSSEPGCVSRCTTTTTTYPYHPLPGYPHPPPTPRRTPVPLHRRGYSSSPGSFWLLRAPLQTCSFRTPLKSLKINKKHKITVFLVS